MGVVAAFALYKKGIQDAENGTDSFASSFAAAIQPVVDIVKDLIGYIVRLLKGIFELGKKLYKLNIQGAIARAIIKNIVDVIGIITSIIGLIVEWLIMAIEGVVNFIKKIPVLGKVIGAVEKFTNKLKGGFSFLKK